jgi:hypothetical protein
VSETASEVDQKTQPKIGQGSRVRVKPTYLVHLFPFIGQEGEVTDVYAAPELRVKLDSGKELQINIEGLELVTNAKKKMAEMVLTKPVLMEPDAFAALVKQLCTS